MNIDQLISNPLFCGIENTDIKALLDCLHAYTKYYQKDEFILRRGDRIHCLGLLLNGKGLIVKEDYWGNRTILKEVDAGDLFAEAYACLATKELEVSLQATQDCEVLFLDIGDITKICATNCLFHQRIIQNLLAISSMKNLILTQKIEHISRRTTREKILSYLSSQSLEIKCQVIKIPFNRQELADYLSVDRSALSNELSKMEKEGIIKYHKNTFQLL